jgi:flavin-dependent dehydrogenase
LKYDVIIVGARAAGAATAMLLARRGIRVLVVDRARYGSDTLSTHALMRPALVQLERWGLLDAVIASGAPPIRRTVFHYPDEHVAIDIEPLYAPRRTVLDAILVDAAIAAGAEVRFGVAVDDLQKDDSGRIIGISGDGISERAELIVGADGIRSVVAQSAGAATTREAHSQGAIVYAYYSGIKAEAYEWVYGDKVASGLIPTNDGEVCVFVGCSAQRFGQEVQPDLRRGFKQLLAGSSPALAMRVMYGQRTSRYRGFAGIRGYYRKVFGRGWALVGDAGYFRDPITTHGISDAFRDAELLARAIDGTSTFDEYESVRNQATEDMFAITDRITAYDWTNPEIRVHLRNLSQAMKAETKLILRFDRKEAVA